MANREQLRILREEGVDAWNEWRKDNRDVEIDLFRANLYGANLYGANLQDGNLTVAYLNDAMLKGADLYHANLTVANLQDAYLEGVDLKGAMLKGAYLNDANLKDADLKDANLQDAYLEGVDLTGANLKRVQALATNFSNATLTGACIEDWHINSDTNLENVICDYIYLKKDKQERRPSDSSKNFEPGEFAKLVEQSIETVDLIFKEGIDWRAFLPSLHDLRVKYGEQNVSIQAIEKKSDGAFVIRLNVPPDADKGEIESLANESYETNFKVLEAQYRAELQAKDREITLYKEQGSNMMEIAKLLASRPITVEAKAVASSESQGDTINQSGIFGIGQMSGGEIKDNAEVTGKKNVYASGQKQTLAEAAGEIQKLLKQLEQTNPTATVEQQQAYIDIAMPKTLKERCVSALKAAGDTAIEEFVTSSRR